MSCLLDLKAYVVGEVTRQGRTEVESHVRGCESCREELDRLNLTRAALVSLEDEEIPRRIAFVSDRVFEPRWWQTMWRSGPTMGFASAALLASAILVHGFEARPAAPGVDQAQIEQRVNASVAKSVTKAVSEAEAKQAADFAKVLNATQRQRESDLATFQQAAEYYQKQMARFEYASNVGNGQ
jgi:anti-sigma factor RsiW